MIKVPAREASSSQTPAMSAAHREVIGGLSIYVAVGGTHPAPPPSRSR
jgi:hypothetical protein